MKSFLLNAVLSFFLLTVCFIGLSFGAVSEPAPSGDCKSTVGACGPGDCSTAATDCTSKFNCFCN